MRNGHTLLSKLVPRRNYKQSVEIRECYGSYPESLDKQSITREGENARSGNQSAEYTP
jgi:hypothetical protein